MNQPMSFLYSESGLWHATTASETNAIMPHVFLAGPEAAGERAHYFHQLLDALPAAVYTTDAEGNITYYNDAAAELWGHRPAPGSSKWNGALRLRRPDGTRMAHDESPLAVALKEKRRLRAVEVIAERPDGTHVPFLAHPAPLYDDAGRLTGGVDMMIDITGRKRTESQQSLLLRELHHRVKNTLATVQAIMGATARTATSVEEFENTLIGRIGSLANTHLLLAEEARTVGFAELLRKELGAFDDGSEDRIIMRGPDVELSTRFAVPLGIALHELTTNSAKFGALSVPDGKVSASWRISEDGDRRTLDFDWVESGGPAVTPPTRTGFGTRLMEIVLPGQIGARTRVDYAPEGVRVHYTVPLRIKD